jgi:UPF0716 protein FxsA
VFALLVLVFIVVPVVELFVIIQVGQEIGALNTIALLLVVGIAGAWLMKREGVGVLRRIQRISAAGGVPTRELADGFLILCGGALMLLPGFVSDGLGLALLLPPVRAVIRPLLLRRFVVSGPDQRGVGRSTVIDL